MTIHVPVVSTPTTETAAGVLIRREGKRADEPVIGRIVSAVVKPTGIIGVDAIEFIFDVDERIATFSEANGHLVVDLSEHTGRVLGARLLPSFMLVR